MGEMILINVRKEKEKGSEDEEEREEKGSRREVYKHISQEKTEHKRLDFYKRKVKSSDTEKVSQRSLCVSTCLYVY